MLVTIQWKRVFDFLKLQQKKVIAFLEREETTIEFDVRPFFNLANRVSGRLTSLQKSQVAEMKALLQIFVKAKVKKMRQQTQ